MVEAETHTREELEGMSRLLLRRICKGRGMSSEECSKMEFDDMVAWIDDNQEGGGRSRKAAPKSSSKAAPKGGKKAPPKGSGKKAPPKSPPKGRTKAKDEDAEDESSSSGLVGDQILAEIQELREENKTLHEKIDTLGEVVDQNLNALTEDMNELRADAYKTLELVKHLGIWMEADQILTSANAPESLGFPEKEADLDEACSGNEDGGE